MPLTFGEIKSRTIVGIIYASIFLLAARNTDHTLLICLLIFICISCFIEFYQITKKSNNFFFKLLTPLIFIFFPIYCLFLIKSQFINGEDLLTFLILLIWASDISAFFTGKLFGKIKLTKYSPNKTLEGLLGSFIACLILGPNIMLLMKIKFNINIYLLSFLISLSGNFGDYLESLLKRNFNKKDSGNILRSHGGIFDRIDSLLISAPLFYFILK